MLCSSILYFLCQITALMYMRQAEIPMLTAGHDVNTLGKATKEPLSCGILRNVQIDLDQPQQKLMSTCRRNNKNR